MLKPIDADGYSAQIGTYIWFFSLRQLNEFAAIWAKQSPAVQQAIQDNVSGFGFPGVRKLVQRCSVRPMIVMLLTRCRAQFSCCGYWNSTAAGEFTTQLGFCADVTPTTNVTGCESFSECRIG